MSRLPFEQHLLNEYQALENLNRLFTTFVDLLDHVLFEQGEDIDDDLRGYLNMLLVMAKGINELVIVDPETEAETLGITKQMAEVMEEIEVLQAGLPCKRGIPEEDCDEMPPESGNA